MLHKSHRLGWSDFDIRYRILLGLFVATLVGGMGWSAFWHHNQYVAADTARIAAQLQAESQQKTINELTAREKALLARDSLHAQQLADARATIHQLQNRPQNTSL